MTLIFAENFLPLVINHGPGAAVFVKVVDINSRRSLLVQGGSEIVIKLCVVMPLSDVNQKALDTYTTLINENYEEPVNGNFPDVTASVLNLLIFKHQVSQSHKMRKNNRKQL